MIHRQKLVYVQSFDVDVLIEASDGKLLKNENKGWKLTDIRAQIAPNNESLSIIKMVFEKYCFDDPISELPKEGV